MIFLPIIKHWAENNYLESKIEMYIKAAINISSLPKIFLLVAQWLTLLVPISAGFVEAVSTECGVPLGRVIPGQLTSCMRCNTLDDFEYGISGRLSAMEDRREVLGRSSMVSSVADLAGGAVVMMTSGKLKRAIVFENVVFIFHGFLACVLGFFECLEQLPLVAWRFSKSAKSYCKVENNWIMNCALNIT